MRRRALLALVSVAALAACAAPARGTAQAERAVTLTARWSKFSRERIEVPVGTTVRFVVRNDDPVAHELIVG
ncbi:MAG TPA: cupredoxin domain-containing protein, partial [Acidimicrobiales bacterium]|nr:cupredoxin domain-containing protein [Acidimicrobiales bacterium]